MEDRIKITAGSLLNLATTDGLEQCFSIELWIKGKEEIPYCQ